MKQGINLSYVLYQRNVEGKRNFEDAVRICKDSGFIELDYRSPLETEDFLAVTAKEKAILDRYGMKVHQAHAPFCRYQDDGMRLFPEMAKRAIESASLLGAEYLVFHADECRPLSGEPYDSKQILDKNYELMAPAVEYCLKLGVKPAFENLFEDGFKASGGMRSRFCSHPEELAALIEKFNDPSVGWCLDLGHALCSDGEDHVKMLDTLGKHLFCTHMHDNYYGKDLHLPAFFGTARWEDVMTSLKQIGYSGDFTWELVYGRFPDALLSEYLKFVHKIGEHLLSL